MIISEIKKLLESGIEKKHFPGASYCLIKSDIIICDFVGYKQIIPTYTPNSGKEIYDVASLTKVVSTTTLILHLIEEKKLSFDTKIAYILPRFKYPDITVYDLLMHTSGLAASIRAAHKMKSRDDVLNAVYQAELVKKKHTHIIYSDIGYILLGQVIEKITRKSLDVYANEIIFMPLGMKDSSYRPEKNRCSPTEMRADDVYQGLLKGVVHDEKAFAMKGLSGHAGLFSTAYDIALFIRAMLSRKHVLSNEMINKIFTEHVTLPDLNGDIQTRTIGWLKPKVGSIAGDFHDVKNTIGHTGFTGCHMFIDKKHEIGFVLLSNAVHPKRDMNRIMSYRNKIGNLIYKEE